MLKIHAIKESGMFQVRLLSEKGMELIRYDLIKDNLVKASNLQDKSSRYYFQEAKDRGIPVDKSFSIKISELDARDYDGFLSLEPHLGHFEGFDDLEGDGDIPEFGEKSDAGKFKLAVDSLRNILKEI